MIGPGELQVVRGEEREKLGGRSHLERLHGVLEHDEKSLHRA
jgi:hypothetical protein